MRKLGLDIGSKRIGISVSDTTNTIASPLKSINRSKIDEEAKQINDLADEYEVEEVIVGLPIDLKGREGIAAQNIKTYVQEISKLISKPLIFIDERFTTKIAENMLTVAGLKKDKRKKVVDEIAATIILQSYLEHEKDKH